MVDRQTPEHGVKVRYKPLNSCVHDCVTLSLHRYIGIGLSPDVTETPSRDGKHPYNKHISNKDGSQAGGHNILKRSDKLYFIFQYTVRNISPISENLLKNDHFM